MESLETTITKKLQDFFKGEVHVKQKCNVLIVDVYFYNSSSFHTSVSIPEEIYITPKLCYDLTSSIINDFFLDFNMCYLA